MINSIVYLNKGCIFGEQLKLKQHEKITRNII